VKEVEMETEMDHRGYNSKGYKDHATDIVAGVVKGYMEISKQINAEAMAEQIVEVLAHHHVGQTVDGRMCPCLQAVGKVMP
jgi:hypothetical protein